MNLKKHRCILDELEVNGLIQKSESQFGKRIVTVYKPTQKGIEFSRSILEPYERIFPRKEKKEESVVIVNTNTNNASNVKLSRKAIDDQQEIELQQQQKS